MILRLLALLIISVTATAAPIPSADVTADNYKEEMGFRFSGVTAKKLLGGIVDYDLAIDRDIWNDTVGVALVFVRDKQVLGTLPLTGVDTDLSPKRKRRYMVGFQLAPELAKDAILVFQLHPNTEAVKMIHLQLGSWPVTVIQEDKTKKKVKLEDVRKAIEVE